MSRNELNYDMDLYLDLIDNYDKKDLKAMKKRINDFRTGKFQQSYDVRVFSPPKEPVQTKDVETEIQKVIDALKRHRGNEIPDYMEKHDLIPKKSGSWFSCC